MCPLEVALFRAVVSISEVALSKRGVACVHGSTGGTAGRARGVVSRDRLCR